MFLEQWDKELEDVTLAPTAIRGGEPETCMIPETAQLTMDVRYKTRETSSRCISRLWRSRRWVPAFGWRYRAKLTSR